MMYKINYDKMTGKNFIIAGLIETGKIKIPKPFCRQCNSRLGEDHELDCMFHDSVKVFFGQTLVGARGKRCHICDKREGSKHSPSCPYPGRVTFEEFNIKDVLRPALHCFYCGSANVRQSGLDRYCNDCNKHRIYQDSDLKT